MGTRGQQAPLPAPNPIQAGLLEGDYITFSPLSTFPALDSCSGRKQIRDRPVKESECGAHKVDSGLSHGYLCCAVSVLLFLCIKKEQSVCVQVLTVPTFLIHSRIMRTSSDLDWALHP